MMTGPVICWYVSVFCTLLFEVRYFCEGPSSQETVFTIFADLSGKLYVHTLFVNVFKKIVNYLLFTAAKVLST